MRYVVLIGVISMAVLQAACSGAGIEIDIPANESPVSVDAATVESGTAAATTENSVEPAAEVVAQRTPEAEATSEGEPEEGGGGALEVASCGSPVCFGETVELLELLDRSIDNNVLKLFGAAAGSTENRIYVSGIMSSYIGVLDAASGEWIDTIDTEIDVQSIKYVYSEAGSNWLYVVDAGGGSLRRIDLVSGELDAVVDLGSLSGHEAIVDETRNQLILATRDGGLQAFGGEEFGLVWQETSFGERAGPMVLDVEANLLYVMDPQSTADVRDIFVVDPSSGAVVDTLTYAVSPGERGRWLMLDDDGRLLVGTERGVHAVGNDGRTFPVARFLKDSTVSDMVFVEGSDEIAVLSLMNPQDGVVSAREGRLDVFSAGDGSLVASLSFGNKPKRMTLNTADGNIYVPNGDASIVWAIDTEDYAAAEPIRLGDTVEQVAVAANGKVYLASRLGGSYLTEYDVETGAIETFIAGIWPIPVQTNVSGERLLIVNAWDSSLSVYDVSGEREFMATIDFGIPDGSTDRLPSMAVDSSRSIAYVAYPEFGQVMVVDFERMAMVEIIELERFRVGDIGGGPGQIQLGVDEVANRLFVMRTTEQVIEVYDGNRDYVEIARLGQRDLDWSALPKMGNSLFLDSENHRLFLGPLEIDSLTLEATGRIAGDGLFLVGQDAIRQIYWAFSDGLSPELVMLDIETLEVIYSESLPGSHRLPPVLGVDQEAGLAFVGHQAEAVLDIFTLPD